MAFMAAIPALFAAGGGAAAAAGGAAAATGITASTAAAAASLLATGISTVSMLKQGNDAKAMAKFQAQQQKANALAETAAGQHASLARRRESELRQSRALAVAGASGAGTLDPDVLNIISGLASQGEREFQAENFNSQSQAAFSEAQARGTLFEGNQARTASRINAASTFLSGATDSVMFFGRPRSSGESNANTVDTLRRNA